jgi:GAF domain-containing protein
MPSGKEKPNIRGLIERILEPNSSIKDPISRQQARITTLTSLILTGGSILVVIVGLFLGFPASLVIGFFILALAMAAACITGRSENFLIGSNILVGGIILAGFLTASAFPEGTTIIVILMSTVVPAFTLGIMLLPFIALVIIAVVVLITVGILPLMASITPGTELLIYIGLIIIEAIFLMVARLKDISDSLQQDEIGSLRGRLEERLEERTRYSKIASEIAQDLFSATSLEKLSDEAVTSIVSRFGFTFAGFYLVDNTSRKLTLQAGQGSEAERMLRAGSTINFGPPSLLGWVAENKQQHLTTRIAEDPLHLESELISGNQSELGIPVISGDRLLGVLDVQSARSTVFDNETIVVLQMLANQMAAAIQKVRSLEVEQGSVQELIGVYQAGYRVDQAISDGQVFQVTQELLSKTPYVSLLLISDGKGLRLVTKSDSRQSESVPLANSITVSIEELAPILTSDIFIGEGARLNSLPYNLVSILRQLQIFSAALLPLRQKSATTGVLIIGTREKTPLVQTNIQPYTNFVTQIGVTLDRIAEKQRRDLQISEMDISSRVSSLITKARTDKDVLKAVQELFQAESTSAILLVSSSDQLNVTSHDLREEIASKLAGPVNISASEVYRQLGNRVLVEEVSHLTALYYARHHPELQNFIANEASKLPDLHPDLIKLIEAAQFNSTALIPIVHNENLESLIIVGTESESPLSPSVSSCSAITDLIISTFDRIRGEQAFENRLNEENSRLLEETRTRAIQLQAATEVAKATTDVEIFYAVQKLFQGTPSSTILLTTEKNNLRVSSSANLSLEKQMEGLPEWLNISSRELYNQLGNHVLVEETSKLFALHYAQFHPELQKFIGDEAGKLPTLSVEIVKLIEAAQFTNVALIPIVRNEEMVDLIIVGTKDEKSLTPLISSYTGVSELVTATFGRVRNELAVEHRLNEDETIILMNQEITSIRDLPTLYSTLHTHIRQILGDVSFLVALYESNTNSIQIPYMYEKGVEELAASNKIEPFPIGEGLISILIRTKQPLMLVEDTERRAAALGAKIVGKTAKSWLGTPLIISDEAVGSLVVQDVEREFAFDENDLRLLTNLSTQVAGAIHNARLLEQMRSRAIQLQTAAEVARDISGSLDLSELLSKAVTLIRDRFNYYHASIFLIDAMNEFATIREATGEAGMQMKRAGHKLKVGSKSIVGYVTGSGEPLTVNDTSRDATYYANPLLPETRAEVAIPLKVGLRVLGALDVQSTRPYSFGDEDISVLRILADQMAIAVINSELFADTQEHLSQHRLLHHVTTAAASGTTLEESLNSATQGLQVTLGGDRVSILLADKSKKLLRVRAFAGYSEEIAELEIPFDEGITGWVATHLQLQRINDVSQDPRYVQVGSNVRSELAVPLSYRGDLLGVLNVESDQAGAYNENDEEMLGTLAGSLAAIISNARLIDQVRRQVDHERMLFEVTSKIRRSTDMQTIMATTTGELSKVLGARRAEIKIGLKETQPQASHEEINTAPAIGDSA